MQTAHTESTIPKVRAAFDRAAQIDDITSVRGDDLDIQPVGQPGQGFVVSFAYRKEIHLFSLASLVLDYKGSSH